MLSRNEALDWIVDNAKSWNDLLLNPVDGWCWIKPEGFNTHHLVPLNTGEAPIKEQDWAFALQEKSKKVIPLSSEFTIKCTPTRIDEKYNSLEEAEKLSADYASLSKVLRRAYDQAAIGKGAERHAKDLPFTQQPMQRLQELYGVGFALGQAGKKMQESMRLPHDAAIRELLGAINYIAGAVIHMEKENNK